ncbi:helitron_like_N domain-containing protein [Trichonephila clavipes]|nr:helitron_like_N domain-containing protein [Trichonephila clavipes]
MKAALKRAGGTDVGRVPRGEHEERFNAPTTNEIAAVVVSSERTASWDIVIQFLVNMYVKVESECLRFIFFNQTKLRAENYIHLQDMIRNDADLDPNNLGQMVILPSSFENSAKYLHEYTQDAFYGRPDLFITMTCNPAWPEKSLESSFQVKIQRTDMT